MKKQYLVCIISFTTIMQCIQTNGNKTKQVESKALMSDDAHDLSERTSLITTQVNNSEQLVTHAAIVLEGSVRDTFVGRSTTNCCDELQDAPPGTFFCCYVPVSVLACCKNLKELFLSKK